MSNQKLMTLKIILHRMGISDKNYAANIYTYTLYATQSLDFAANAASRVDAEAGSYLRRAYSILHFRLDLMNEFAVYGESDENGRTFGVNNKLITKFDHIIPLFSAISTGAFTDENLDTEGEIGVVVDDLLQYSKSEAVFVRDLAFIALAEQYIYTTSLDNLVHCINKNQLESFRMLQVAAITAHDLVLAALQTLKATMEGGTFLRACQVCGYIQVEGTSDPCPLCGTSPGNICRYPVHPSKAALNVYD